MVHKIRDEVVLTQKDREEIAPYLNGAALKAARKRDFRAVGIMLTLNPGVAYATDAAVTPSPYRRAEEPCPLARAAEIAGHTSLAQAIGAYMAAEPSSRVWKNPLEEMKQASGEISTVRHSHASKPFFHSARKHELPLKHRRRHPEHPHHTDHNRHPHHRNHSFHHH